MEWVYVLRPDLQVMEVWTRQALHGAHVHERLLPENPRHRYTHVRVATVDLDSEPDWKAIEDAGKRLREERTWATA